MDGLDDFLRRLLFEGRVVFRRAPEPETPASPEAIAVLARAFATRRLEVAEPVIPFDPRVAAAAGELVRQASWALVNRGDRPKELAGKVVMPMAPKTAAHHLSADLALRFLPQIERRARGIDPADSLVRLLGSVLRSWPLSGVLTGLHEGPDTPTDLAGHPGLMLLYAERLARHDRPGWRPAEGAIPHVELVGRSTMRDGRGVRNG